ncbi:MRC [Mytilus coruscus]|uniref:MRC n=1 Tax=Mytilus coruscus TaxID=42192 RepID=A0A6J8CJN1_MYTCO|nr:MRC [Mytilus coruscus]
MGGELVAINSEDENNYITEQAKIMDSCANDRVKENTFVWGDSSDPVVIHNWRYLEPDGGTLENCVYITRTYHFFWGDLKCSTSLPYICERTSNPQPSPVEVSMFHKTTDAVIGPTEINLIQVKDCPLGWVIPTNVTSTSCYLFSTDSKNWENAQIECRNNGANLVAINSEEEMFYIKEQAKDRNSHFWLGANDRLNEGIFVWGDSNETLTVNDWRVFLPSGGTTDNCIYISKKYLFNWFDTKCSDVIPFICEQG